MRLLVLFILFCTTASFERSAYATIFDISDPKIGSEKIRNLSVTTNDVIFIKVISSGGVAVVQFTSFSSTNFSASYRWRYRSSSSQAVLQGVGQVHQSYDQEKRDEGTGYDVTPKADNDAMVRAGDIHIKWSYNSALSGYLYYWLSEADVQILGPDAFDKDL